MMREGETLSSHESDYAHLRVIVMISMEIVSLMLDPRLRKRTKGVDEVTGPVQVCWTKELVS